MNWKRYILVGIPGIGKSQLASDLRVRLGADRFSTIGSATDWLHPEDYALGPQLDYRAELYLAAARTFSHLSEAHTHIIYDGSLVDSFAHSTVNLDRMIKFENVDQNTLDRTVMTAALIGGMMTDSVKQDYVFLLERALNVDPTDEDYLLQKRMREILDEWQINYMVLEEKDKDKWAEQAGVVIADDTRVEEEDGQEEER
jgi:hypothetical protein